MLNLFQCREGGKAERCDWARLDITFRLWANSKATVMPCPDTASPTSAMGLSTNNAKPSTKSERWYCEDMLRGSCRLPRPLLIRGIKPKWTRKKIKDYKRKIAPKYNQRLPTMCWIYFSIRALFLFFNKQLVLLHGAMRSLVLLLSVLRRALPYQRPVIPTERQRVEGSPFCEQLVV